MKFKYLKSVGVLILLLFFAEHQAQVKILNDPSIVAQHKRMVYESWGDWRPYPKYVLGIQTNFAYATVWGWLSPNINQDYKNGADIRPLKPTGEEVQRLTALELERKEAEKIKLQVDSIYARNVQDLAHWTSLTVDADPLWLLYYKKMHSPLNNFPSNPQTAQQWGFTPEIYSNLISNGGIEKLKEQLDILKDQYHNSRTQEMPRGKRFIMYHNTLIGWREFVNSIRAYQQRTNLFLEFKAKITSIKDNPISTSIWNYNDQDIVANIMNKYKQKF